MDPDEAEDLRLCGARPRMLLGAGILLLLVHCAASAQEAVVYRLRHAEPGSGRVSVRITLPGDPVGPVTLVMPRAVPMGYRQQPYDRFVTDAAGRAPDDVWLAVVRESGPRWRIGSDAGRVRHIEYSVDLARMEREILSAADSSRARPRYAGLLGYTVFAFVEGWE